MARVDVAKRLKELEALEWSAFVYGDQRYGGLTDYPYPACSRCWGIKPEGSLGLSWPPERMGHATTCSYPVQLAYMRDKLVRPRLWEFRVSFFFGGMRGPSKRDGQRRYTLQLEANGSRTELLVTKAELEDLHRVVEEFIALDGVD